MTQKHRIGIVGARGHTGAELIELIARHPALELAFVSSRELAGLPVRERIAQYRGDVAYTAMQASDVAAAGADVVMLALPNGKAQPYVDAIVAAAPGTLMVDLSADYRFDPTWFYGLPELTRTRYEGQRRISNPGCYATAMQLALAPLVPLLGGPAQCFGVSGYSGAGTTPSDRNDPEKLRDNIMPYALMDHVHEREVTAQLQHQVEFLPHVASHFRGITLTVNAHLRRRSSIERLRERYRRAYGREPLVHLVDDAPWVSAIAGKHHAEVGGLMLGADGRRVVVVATLDNLLKGAATQALQNVNLALGLNETLGIVP